MSSDKRREANRRNAQKSTGPKSPNGKWRASQNSVTWRLYSRSWLLIGESERELSKLINRLLDKWQPVSDVEEMLVRVIAHALWRLRRLDNSLALRLMHFQREQACKFNPQIALVDGKKIDIQTELSDTLDRYAEDAVPSEDDLKRAGRRFADDENLDHDLKANRVRRELVREVIHAEETLAKLQERRMKNNLG